MNNTYKSILNERIEQYGISSLMDHEAICALTGIPVKEMHTAIETYGLPELIKYLGTFALTKAQSKKLELLYHLVKRISLSDFKEKTVLSSSDKSGEYFVKQLQFYANEVFAIAMLDSQNRLIKTEVVSYGTINEAHVYPREIIKTVLNNNANAVILAHVHPGGSQRPSNADLDVTRKIIAALKTINVSVIDHIIVAENSYISLAEKGLLNS